MQKTIFVVDDNDTNLTLAKDALSDHYRVMTLPSAEKLFKFIERLMPDLILLDIEMPETDGFEALLRLRENPAYEKIPVIFLSGFLDDERREKGIKLGAAGFVEKPFTAPVLLEKVAEGLLIG